MKSWALRLNAHRLLTLGNILIGIALLISLSVLARDVITVRLKKAEKSLPSKQQVGQTVRQPSLQDNEVILKNNPFGLPSGPLTPLASVSGKSSAQGDLVLIGL